MPRLSRRAFLASMAAGAAGLRRTPKAEASNQADTSPKAGSNLPVAVASANGLRAVARAVERMRAGVDPLDAAIEGVNIIEDDPNDMSVGYGGVPNEEGVVQLDACVMHGPTAKAGGVAALGGGKNSSKLGQMDNENTGHVTFDRPR